MYLVNSLATPEASNMAAEKHSTTAAATQGAKSSAQRSHEQRTVDLVFVLGAVLTVLAGIWLAGEVSLTAAAIAGIVIVAFGVIYLNGTADSAGAGFRDDDKRSAHEERAMRAASERGFRAAMIDALPEPAMYIDEQGRVETANAPARREFRFVAPEPLLSMVVRRPELLESVAAVRRENKARLFELVMRDETDRHFTCVAAPVATHDSRGVLVTMHDFTEIKRAEYARVDFLANASHELRTPLTSLAGFIETLKGTARDDPEARDRFLDIMEGQATRMGGLINDLMSLSRIELNEHRPPDATVDLAATTGEVCDALMPVARNRDVNLVLSDVGVELPVIAMPGELAQVAQNLIDNAIKYSEDGAAVDIEVRGGLTLSEAIRFAGRRWADAGRMSIASAVSATRGSFAAIRVTDRGPGIAREHLPRLAERFYRVDQGRGLRPGTGLGLAIVKHIVTRHRGEFLVESIEGRGAAFGVVLPQPGDSGPLKAVGEARVEAQAPRPGQ